MPRFSVALLLVLGPLNAGSPGAPIVASLDLFAAGVPTLDLTSFEPTLLVDVYHFTLTNPNAAPVTSLELSLTGAWLNHGIGQVSFRNETALPTVFTHSLAETFFVLPAGASLLSIGLVDNNELLSASFTLQGGQALAPALGTAVVAVLSAPTGADVYGALHPAFGRGVVNGAFEPVRYAGDFNPVVPHDEPEPAGVTLALLALLGAAKPSLR